MYQFTSVDVCISCLSRSTFGCSQRGRAIYLSDLVQEPAGVLHSLLNYVLPQNSGVEFVEPSISVFFVHFLT